MQGAAHIISGLGSKTPEKFIKFTSCFAAVKSLESSPYFKMSFFLYSFLRFSLWKMSCQTFEWPQKYGKLLLQIFIL